MEGLISIPGADWVCPFLYKDLFLSWNWFPTGKKAKKNWMGALLCLIWEIWNERNQVFYEEVQFSFARIKASFISYLIAWAGLIDVGDSLF